MSGKHFKESVGSKYSLLEKNCEIMGQSIGQKHGPSKKFHILINRRLIIFIKVL